MSLEPLTFKEPALADELALADRRLKVLVYYAAMVSLIHTGKSLLVTRVQSNRDEVSGLYGAGAKLSVHEVIPCRGTDARSHHYTSHEIGVIVSRVNAAFEYRQGSVTFNAAIHETVDVMRRLGRVAPTEEMEHLHFQVPPVTGYDSRVKLWA